MTSRLNPEQELAATCLDRSVFITAGAGSGKTRMLTQRFVNAIIPGAVEGWSPARTDEVVAITFTDKAAGEIADRVRRALRKAGRTEDARRISNAWISTIHGLCNRLLRRHPFDAGIDPLFSVANSTQLGRMREESFEAAVRSLLALKEPASELFELYGYDALFSASLQVMRKAKVLGCAPENLEIEPAEDANALLDEAEELFRSGAATCDLAYEGTSSDPPDHFERCEEALAKCQGLNSVERSDDELLDGLLSVLAAYRPLKRLKGLEEASDALRACRSDLCGRIAAALVAPHSETFKRLVCEFAKILSARKASAGMLDYDDLQVKAVGLLERRPDLAGHYRDQFRVVMIDEFQDTDALQMRLVRALTDGDLCTVGDEKQSIYRFRGADVGVYRAHRENMSVEKALIAKLDVNYRSHTDLLEFVNGVFGSEHFFGSGPGGLLRLVSPPGETPAGPLDVVLGSGPRAEVLFVDSTDVDGSTARKVEAACVARRLAELREAGAGARDMAILLRSYTHAHDYADALSREGIRAVVVGGSRYFDLPEIAVMRALTRVIANAEDGIALGVLLASDFVPVSSDALAILRADARETGSRSLWTLLHGRSEKIHDDDREAIARLRDVIGHAAARVARAPLADVLLFAVEEAGWDLRLLSEGNSGRDAFTNVLKFVRQAAEFESTIGTGPAGLAQHLDARERYGDTEAPLTLADDGSDAVRIMSIHASKGLEFPIVAVPELASRGASDNPVARIAQQGGALALALKTPVQSDGESRPSSTWFAAFSDADKRADAEESARVLYVAFTRARDALLASGAMGMRSKQPTEAKNDLSRLARVLGVATPVTGDSDELMEVPGESVRCRVRVVGASSYSGAADEHAPQDAPALPPAAGETLVDPHALVMPERLSYTQLSEFERCPKRFWVRRVLGVHPVSMSVPGEVDPLRFGNALHAVLRLVASDGEPPPQSRIAAIGRYFELEPTEIARLFKAVTRYCRSEVAIRSTAGGIVRRESPFAMKVGGRFLLTGSIDLYSRTGDSARVVDYKSGETGDLADLQERYRLQAQCYALAVMRDGCADVTVEFVRPEVESPNGGVQSTSFAFAGADGEVIEMELERLCREMEASTFAPTPSSRCFDCDVLLGLCPHTGRRGVSQDL